MKTQKKNHGSFFKYLKRIIFVIPVLLAASWAGDPAENAPVCTATGDQGANRYDKDIVYSGYGKAVIVWKDNRNETSGSDIYAQRVNIHGEIFWMKDGIVVCNAPKNQLNPKVIKDGQGGVIIAWADLRNDTDTTNNSAIYAQRVDSSGAILWTDNGVVVCTEEAGLDIEMISDGQSGAILT